MTETVHSDTDDRLTASENPYFKEVAGGVFVGPNREGYRPFHLEVLDRRTELATEYAWSIPNDAAIDVIVNHSPVIEVGAGTGYWASLVEQAGGEITATDSHPSPKTRWSDIYPLEATQAVREAMASGRDFTLLMVFPPRDDPMAADAARLFHNHGGERLIYVGEGRNGVNANFTFHQQLFRWWDLVDVVEIPTFFGMRDRLEVWERAGPRFEWGDDRA